MKEHNAMSKVTEPDHLDAGSSAGSEPEQPKSTAAPNLTLLETGQSPGAILKAAREKLGLPISEVSSITKINEHQIKAIEGGDMSRLPPPTFAKAFIKSYCKVLKVEHEPILVAFGFDSVATPVNVQGSAKTASGIEPKMPSNSRRLSSLSFDRRGGSKRVGVMVVLAAVVVLAGFYLVEFFSAQETSAEISGSVPAEVQESGPVDAMPSTTVVDGIVQETLPLPLDSGAMGAGNPVFPAVQEEQAKAQAESLGVGSAAAQQQEAEATNQSVVGDNQPKVEASPVDLNAVAAPGQAILTFQFDKESWVTVRDADGKVLMSRLNENGANAQVEGKPPFKLVIGNAESVSLYLNGDPVDLSPSIKAEVARLTLNVE